MVAKSIANKLLSYTSRQTNRVFIQYCLHTRQLTDVSSSSAHILRRPATWTSRSH